MGSLTRRTAGTADAYPAHWHVAQTYQHGRNLIGRGTPLKIRGEHGTFTFWDHVVNPPRGRRRTPREWVTVVGGRAGVTEFRAFRPDRISRVLPVERKHR